MEVAGADVQIPVHTVCDVRGGEVVASEDLRHVRNPSVRFADHGLDALPPKVLDNAGHPFTVLCRRDQPDSFWEEGEGGIQEGERLGHRSRQVVEVHVPVAEVRPLLDQVAPMSGLAMMRAIRAWVRASALPKP